jgi:hypothetical protein
MVEALPAPAHLHGINLLEIRMTECARLDVGLAAQAAVNTIVVRDVAAAVQRRLADVAPEVLSVKRTTKRMDRTIGNDLIAFSALPMT